MKYFRLHFFCIYNDGINSGCIYDTFTGNMIQVAPDNNEILRNAQNNLKVDENNRFLNELCDKNLGQFYDNPVYIEKIRIGGDKRIQSVVEPRTVVNKIFIQVSNDCENNCQWCERGNNIYTRTRCKKWDNRKADISEEDWSVIFSDLKRLGATTICFIGGDPCLELQEMKKITSIALSKDIKNVLVYTNLNYINAEIVDFFKNNKIKIVAQLFGHKGINDEKFWNDNGFDNVKENIKVLTNNNIEVFGNLFVHRYNDDAINILIQEYRSVGIEKLQLSYFYNKPDNSFYSEKYKTNFYKKSFGKVTKESIGFYELYNSCLFGQLYINGSGDVTPCPMINMYKVGNVLETKISQIVKSQMYQKMIYSARNKIEACSKCSFNLNCTDCRAIEWNATSDMFGQEFCEYINWR